MATPWIETLWAGPLLWTLAFVSDYYLTLLGARLYRSGANQHYVFQGSYELTPQFRPAIDRLRWFDPTMVRAIVTTVPLLVLICWISRDYFGYPQPYHFALGALLLVEVPIHLRHLRNIVFFWELKHHPAKGRIEISTSASLRTSARELLVFGLLFSVGAGVFFSALLLGGAVGTLRIALTHWRLARVESVVAPE